MARRDRLKCGRSIRPVHLNELQKGLGGDVEAYHSVEAGGAQIVEELGPFLDLIFLAFGVRECLRDFPGILPTCFGALAAQVRQRHAEPIQAQRLTHSNARARRGNVPPLAGPLQTDSHM